MTDEQYQFEKKRILSQSKNKGLDIWEKVLKHYGISLKKAKTKGFYLQGKGYMVLYFDNEKDQWLIKPVCPKNN
jgi:hypothetical protein